MKRTAFILVPLLMLLLLVTITCKKKNKELACVPDCKNGGTCVNGICDCQDDWAGAGCETYYTYSYVGDYGSTNFNCGQLQGSQVSSVDVDPTNRDRITIGDLYADMTDRNHFTIPKQGSGNYSGSGSIDGVTLVLNFTSVVSGNTIHCSGTYTKN